MYVDSDQLAKAILRQRAQARDKNRQKRAGMRDGQVSERQEVVKYLRKLADEYRDAAEPGCGPELGACAQS